MKLLLGFFGVLLVCVVAILLTGCGGGAKGSVSGGPAKEDRTDIYILGYSLSFDQPGCPALYQGGITGGGHYDFGDAGTYWRFLGNACDSEELMDLLVGFRH